MDVEYLPKIKGYLVHPHTKDFSVGAWPKNPSDLGIVVIHEFWGLNGQIKRVADKFASEGFSALAIDLYKGKVAKTPEEARATKDALKDDEALENIKSAVRYFETLGISADKVALAGFCMGGGFVFKAATAGVKAGAYVIYYGQIKDDPELLKKIVSPVLGIFGGLDKSIPRERVESFHRALHDLNEDHEVYIYSEADHAFANEDRPIYNKKAAEDAWRKTIEFLNKKL